jgi:hypothetical protein
MRDAMQKLHNAIMDIQYQKEDIFKHMTESEKHCYKLGHKDARHAAAELSVKYDCIIDMLINKLQGISNDLHKVSYLSSGNNSF